MFNDSRLDSACREAVAWVGTKPLEEAWNTCKRGDWMLWLAARLEIDKKLLVTAACDCAELSLKFITAGEDRPRQAIEMARKWVRGETSLEEVCKAVYAAANAANAANAAYAAYAARAVYAAANAANAANAAYAAARAAYAAYAAARAAYAADAETLKICAEKVRAAISYETVASCLKA
jgi:hypothetical protein